MKTKLSGAGAQTNRAPTALLPTRFRLSSNNVPEPDKGAEPVAKADIRSVLIGPLPGSTFPITLQL